MMPKRSLDLVPLLTLIVAAIAWFLWIFNSASRWKASTYSQVLLGIGAVLVAGLHIWAARLNPIQEPVSEYSLVPLTGTWMRVAFFCFGAAIGNLAYSLRIFSAAGLPLTVVLAAACVFTFFMGVFSMRDNSPGLLHTSETDGLVHNMSTGSAFLLAIVSMGMFACWPPHTVSRSYDWLRAVALSQCVVSVVAALAYIVLSITKLAVVRRISRSRGYLELLRDDARLTMSSKRGHETQEGLPAAAPAAQDRTPSVPHAREALHSVSRGLGLSERILIVLLLEWAVILSAFVRLT